MSNKYYYLASSLPYLSLEESLPVTREDFLSECQKWLSTADYKKLENIDINNFDIKPSDGPVIREWKTFDSELRTELAEVRKETALLPQGKVPERFKEVFDEDTPLAMEKRLQKLRWYFLDEKEFGYYFDLNILMLYYLKLQCLERLAGFDAERGKAVFERVSEAKYG